MKRNVLFLIVLSLILMGLQSPVEAQTIFSAVSPSGHTLYYRVVDADNYYVKLTFSQNGSIVVETLIGEQVQVFDVVGRRLYNTISTGNDLFEMSSSGAYMVKVGTYPARRSCCY